MAYQVLARKWRPRSFAEMVGQEHVLRALSHALDSGRVHHAFLFTGTRGVGKTTIARILAKSLNCERGVSSRPCGVCSACREIDEGRFVDLIEVDAASRTKVEETRELLENVQYTPTFGRYKVYLIDEVHMFSKSSFNAMLKTLEEPPPHVKFLLATTDPQKLPVTILSRCLQFNLRSLSLPLIRNQLAYILNAEEIPFEEVALRELARGADGSMRDGLSLLDQAIAYGGGKVLVDDVYAMLGSLSRDLVYPLIDAIVVGDAAALLASLDNLASRSPNWSDLLGEIIGLLQRIAIAQFVPEAVDDNLGDRERILGLAKRMTIEDVQLYYQIGLLGRRDISFAPDLRCGFEMIMLRMLVFRPLPDGEFGCASFSLSDSGRVGSTYKGISLSNLDTETKRSLQADSSPPMPLSSQELLSAPREEDVTPLPVNETFFVSDKGGKRRGRIESQVVDNVVSLPTSAEIAAEGFISSTSIEWSQLVERLGLSANNRQLAIHCSLQRVDGSTLYLLLDKSKSFLLNRSRERMVEEAVQKHLGAEMRIVFSTAANLADVSSSSDTTPAQLLEIRQQERDANARLSIDSDPCVRTFQETLSAEVDIASIRPADG